MRGIIKSRITCLTKCIKGKEGECSDTELHLHSDWTRVENVAVTLKKEIGKIKRWPEKDW